jgi:hypothetical protein
MRNKLSEQDPIGAYQRKATATRRVGQEGSAPVARLARKHSSPTATLRFALPVNAKGRERMQWITIILPEERTTR